MECRNTCSSIVPQLYDNKVDTDPVVAEQIIEKLELPKGSIDPENGLIVDDNYTLVEQNCSTCHSLKLVTQNKVDREGWKDIIV